MKTLNNILSLAIAAGAGLAIGWLAAPKKGKKTSSIIADELQNYKDSLDAYSKEKLRETKKIIENNLANQQTNGSDAIKKINEIVGR